MVTTASFTHLLTKVIPAFFGNIGVFTTHSHTRPPGLKTTTEKCRNERLLVISAPLWRDTGA